MVALLRRADIHVNGTRAWDIKIKNSRLFSRVAREGVTGLGEAYVDGWWECDQLDVFFDKLIRADLPVEFKNHWTTWGIFLKEKIFNLQDRQSARKFIKHHYDLGNDLFELMLDKRMTYTCGYWKNAKTLDAAQEAKLDLVCKKIGLKKGMSVLDIGCGWGSFIKFAAEKYGARCVGITLSKEQARYANGSCTGLPVEVRVQDYRDVREKFDRVVSLGMFEHVGPKNYQTYMRAAHAALKDDGLFLLHCFGGTYPTPNRMQPETRWVEKYIFPGMALPSVGQIFSAADSLFLPLDMHNFGHYYDPTLMAWFANCQRNQRTIKEKYGERFYRLWRYYLLLCAGGFRSGKYHLWQIVFSKKPLQRVYEAVR